MRAAGALKRSLAFPLLGLALVGCDRGNEQLGSPTVSVDTTATGVVQVSYSSIPAGPSSEPQEDLRIGRDPDVVFGDIRAIELAGDTARWFVGLHTDALGVQSVIGSRLPSALLQVGGMKPDMNQEAR